MSDIYSDRLFTGLEQTAPAPGMVLVSAPGIQSADFARSVILLIEHDYTTTFGVNLAFRTDEAVANVLPHWLESVAAPQALYLGGPVMPQSAVGVGVTQPNIDIATRPYLRRLANRIAVVDLTADPEVVKNDVVGIRVFIGFTYWEPGQLEQEIVRGDWYVAPCLPSDVIAAGPVDVWGDVMRRQPMPLPLFSTFPETLGEN